MLPGELNKLFGTVKPNCDQHPDREALYRLAGETDSFGTEYHYLCPECYNQHQKAAKEAAKNPPLETCDWCKTPGVQVWAHRDFEEGTHGPVYQVCKACLKREAERLRDEY